MPQIDGGHLVAKALKKEGVKYVFALWSAQITPILLGCRDEGIEVIDVRHEQAAAHAADGWAKVTGQPGIAVVMGGPGVSGTLVAVTTALRASNPMILISGRSPFEEWDKVPPQELDCAVELMRPITKWAKRALDTKRIPEYLSMAFRHAIGPSPGPVFLEISRNFLYDQVDEAEVPFPTNYRTAARPQGDPELVKTAAELLNKAERPVAIAGSSVWWSQAARELQEFVERARIPIFLNAMGRGSIPPKHQLFFTRTRRFALSQADVVLSIGAPFDFRLGYGRPPVFPEKVKVIQIDFDATDIGLNRPIDVGITGDIKAVLKQLTSEIDERISSEQRAAWVEKLRQQEIELNKADEPSLYSDAIPIHPLRLCRELRDFLDDDATVVGDGGDIVTFGIRVLRVHYPGHWLDPGPMGSLGVGTGYAMAAKLARPDKQVLLLSGDGSFGLNGMEFDTMARHNINVVCVIGNDGAWGEVKHEINERLGRPVAELSRARRYDKVVEALGGYGELVERPEDIRPALERGFASGLPACINVLTDPSVAYGRRGA